MSGLFRDLGDRWPSTWVARTEVARFSGGLINSKTLANLDAAGEGPDGRVRVGRKIAYSVSELVRWLEARAQKVGA